MDDESSYSSHDSGYDPENESYMDIESDASNIVPDPDHDGWRTFSYVFISVLEYFGLIFEKHH